MPLPFFDRRDIRMLSLPRRSPAIPTMARWRRPDRSSWFGALAAYRGARFPVQVNALPPRGNAVVMVAGGPGQLPEEVAAPKGPTLTVQPNPNDANGKLLIVSGRNVAELKQPPLRWHWAARVSRATRW
jgi:hypothetical protein